MRFAATLVSPEPQGVAAALEAVSYALERLGAKIESIDLLGPNAGDLIFQGHTLAGSRLAAQTALEGRAVDVCVQPAEGRRKRLLVADMISTIIGCECLDELADFAGKKAEIAAITERAMAGELEFEGALRARVAMLAGLSAEALQQCYDKRVKLNPGAVSLVKTMGVGGARCVLVSGGFSFFTERVAELAGFAAHRANRLDILDGALTGRVGEPILGREAKLAALREEAAAMDAPLEATLAVGDGANDLAMVEAAGLGVAYRAKPVVAAQADARLDHADLTALLYFQGYRFEQFVTDGN